VSGRDQEAALGIAGGSAGVVLRLGRLLDAESGFSIVVAMDQGGGGVPDEFVAPVDKVQDIIAAKPDGVLLTAGLARRSSGSRARRDAPALIVALDIVLHREPHGVGPSVAQGPGSSVAEAMRLNADAVKTMLIMGGDSPADQNRNMSFLAKTGEQCRRWEIPMMIEPYLWGVNMPTDMSGRAQVAADGARLAVELGADLVKIEYSGDPDVFRELVQACPVPVFMLGGPKRPTQREVLADVIFAAEVGVVGVTMGRNIWQQRDPARMIRALRVAASTRDLGAAMAELETGSPVLA
jgi:fructose-bisphosphate aldolase, class I